MPKSRLGKLSFMLLVIFIVIFLFTSVVVVGLFNQEGGNTFTDNLYISIPMFSAFFSAIVAFVTGVVSVWKYKEKSLLVYLPIAVGLLITLFIIGELATPH